MWYDFYGKITDPIEMWAGTVNWDVHRDITQPELLKWIPATVMAKSDIVYRRKGIIDYILFPWKTKLTFKSYDSGREAFQGKSLRYLWLDEEPETDIWFESKMRLLDQKGFATLTMTPLKGLTWAYQEIYLNESQDPEIESYHFSWDDNPWLDDAEKTRMLATMSEDEIAARKFGEFMASGSLVLSRQKLMERRRAIQQKPPIIARATWNEGGLFNTDDIGPLEIYKKPEPGRFYILGADVAEGLPSGDNSVGCVIDASTAEQVAEWAVRVDVTTFAKQLDWVGKFYNLAMIAPERNNNGHAVLQYLDQVIMYPALYKFPGDERYGWPETGTTRPIVVAKMQEMISDSAQTVNSKGLLEEGMTFVRNSRGRPEAAGKGNVSGMKDDRLFAWAIANVVREQYGPPLTPVEPKRPMDQQTRGKPSWFVDNDEDRQTGIYAKWDPSQYASFEMNPLKPGR
jgi:phage terminase large subunit-like protein